MGSIGSFYGGGGVTAAEVNLGASTLAALQAMSPVVGQWAKPTDSPYTLVCRVAGAWAYRYPGIGFDVTPPPTAGWSWYTQGGSTVTVLGGVRHIAIPAEAFTNWRGEYRARPSDPTVTPYSVEAIFVRAYTSASGSTAAAFLGTTDTTGMAHARTGGSFAISCNRMAASDGSGGGGDGALSGDVTWPVGLRFSEDGTLRHFATLDPVTRLTSEYQAGFGRTVTITGTHSIWGGTPTADTNVPSRISLVHWKETLL